MKIKALRPFISTTVGDVKLDQIVEVSDGYGTHLVLHGMAERVYDTKVIREVPTVPGEAKPSASSPVDQASHKTTQKRRGRPAKHSS